MIQRCNLTQDLEAYYIEVSIRQRGVERGLQQLPLYLPHELIHRLWRANPQLVLDRFMGEGGVDGVEGYWRRMMDQQWLLEHPGFSSVRREPKRCFPIRLHGDDAPCTKDKGFTFLNISGVLVQDKPSLKSRLLLAAVKFNTLKQELAKYKDQLRDVKSNEEAACLVKEGPVKQTALRDLVKQWNKMKRAF